MTYEKDVSNVIDKIDASAAPMVVFGIGIPGSGKSSFLRELGGRLDTELVDVDRIRTRIKSKGWQEGSYDEFLHQVDSEVSTHISRGGVALLDSTNCYEDERRRSIDMYRSIGARTIAAVWLNTPLEIASVRNDSRSNSARIEPGTIKAMSLALDAHQPFISEDFDWIYRI